MKKLIVALTFIVCFAATAAATTFQVGPSRPFKKL